MNEQVFISYRRDGGDITAKLICEALKNRGYTVFYDYDSISGGYFDERIIDAIKGCNDFVMVLPQNSLDRCVNKEDWVRTEIICALSNNKHIIPVMLPGFEFPKDLPEDIADISRINAVHFVMEYFEGVIDTICNRMTSVPSGNIVSNTSKETVSQGLGYTFDDNLNGYCVEVGKCTDTEIRVPDLYNGKAVVGISEDGFRGCSGLKAIFLPETIKNIAEGAFYGCTLLEKVNIPSKVTEIGKWGFYDCSSLKNVFIPKSVRKIGARAFTHCTSMLNFKVEEDNLFFCDHDANLFTKDMKTFVAYACAKSDTSYTVPDGVTRIAESAFSNAASLYEIILPDTVSRIEKFAFIDCSNLERIEIPDFAAFLGDFAFKRCLSLKSITIPNGIQSIGEDTFRGCTALETVILPESLRAIGESVFYECSQLESINLPNSLTDIGKWAFYKCTAIKNIQIPKSLKDIGARAFTDCTSLLRFDVDKSSPYFCDLDGNLYSKNMHTLVAYACGKNEKSYTVPNGVRNIADSAFSTATSLSDIILPNTVNIIEKFAFVDCTNLERITLPNSAALLADFAFKRCASLKTITVPRGVQTIGEDCFRGCSSLTAVILPESIKVISESAFYECTMLESIKIPNKVTDIGKWAFYDCTSIKSIAIPKNVERIGTRAFAGCTGLEKITCSIFNRHFRSTKEALFTKDMKKLFAYAVGQARESYVIPDGVTHIEDSAFSHGTLREITIPCEVANIGEYSFNRCDKLKTISFNGTVERYNNVNIKKNSFNKVAAKEIRCTDGIIKL